MSHSRSSLKIELRPDDLDVLAAWAFEEYRSPQEQASYIIAQALKQRESTTTYAPMTPSQIREAREARGLTQIELAAQAGISHRTLQGFEAGERKCSRSTLRLVQAALKGISANGT